MLWELLEGQLIFERTARHKVSCRHVDRCNPELFRTFPKPFVNAAAFAKWCLEIPWRGREQGEGFDEVGLAGGVGADEDIEGFERELGVSGPKERMFWRQME